MITRNTTASIDHLGGFIQDECRLTYRFLCFQLRRIVIMSVTRIHVLRYEYYLRVLVYVIISVFLYVLLCSCMLLRLVDPVLQADPEKRGQTLLTRLHPLSATLCEIGRAEIRTPEEFQKPYGIDYVFKHVLSKSPFSEHAQRRQHENGVVVANSIFLSGRKRDTCTREKLEIRLENVYYKL